MTEEKAKQTVLGSQALGILAGSIREGSFKELYRDWKWIFRYSRKFRGMIILYTLLGVLGGLMSILGALAGKFLIDIITGYDSSRLWIAAVIFVASTACGIALTSLSSRLSAKLSVNINNDIQAELFDRLLDSDWMELNRYRSGDLLNRFTGDVGAISSNAVSWLPKLVVYAFTFAATLCVILYYDAVMALIALISAPVLLAASRYLMSRMRAYNSEMKAVSSAMMSFEVESLDNMDAVKSFGVEKQTSAKLREWQEKWKQVNLDYNLFGIKTNVWLSALGALIQLIAFAYCLWRLWSGKIIFGTMVLFLQQRTSLSNAFSGLVSQIPTALTAAVSAQRVREVMELEPERHGGTAETFEGGCTVTIKDVDFGYGESGRVISSADFIARPGEITALVGPSGEGKTTILRLILGLVHPERGSAVITDGSGRELELSADTRTLFSYVPQGNTVTSGTVAENLRLVREDATDEELENALKLACAWDFVSRLPEGMYSEVGEHGRGLSEGQAQRIAIARAILRDAPVMLLDEATSALDVATERSILRNIAESRGGRSIIVTTHRPSVLDICSRVYQVRGHELNELTDEQSRKMVMEF